MSDEFLISACEAGVRRLTLDGGAAHPLSLGMIRALHRTIDEAVSDPETRVIMIHGPGTIFCAGHDLKEIAAHRAGPDHGATYLTELFDACAAMMQALVGCPLPTIAVVEGIATAAGLQLVASCDLAYASTAARVCLPGVRNGGFCSTPAVAVARVIGQKHLMDLLLTGEDRTADWALRAGLFTEVLPQADLHPRVDAVARTLATRAAGAIATGKATLAAQIDLPLDRAYALASPVMVQSFLSPDRKR